MRWAEQQQKAQGFWDSALSHKADYGWHIRDRLWIRGETGCGPRETSAQQLKALAGQLRQCPCIPVRVLGLLLPNGMPPAMWSSLPFTIHRQILHHATAKHPQSPSVPGLCPQLRLEAMTQTQTHNLGGTGSGSSSLHDF